MRRISVRGRVASAVVSALALALGTTTLGAAPAGASGVSLSAVRQVGFSGHAALYAWGAATFSDGSLLIGDYLNFRVLHYATDGTLLGVLVPPSSTHMSPYGIGVDPRNDDFYFGDVDAGATVDKYDHNGNFLFQFGGTSEFKYPSYVAVASDGRVFVADSRANKIAVHDSSGNFLFTFGTTGTGPGQFRTPRGIAFDSSDRLFVADTNNNRIQVFDSTGHFLYKWTVSQGGFRGLEIDKANGWLYVVSQGTGLVLKYDLNGNFLTQFGGQGSAPGKFIDGGRDVAVDGNGDVWVGDMPDFRVQKFDSNGNLLADYPNPPSPPPPGGFNNPSDVALDANANIFGVDTFNWRIEKFGPNGTFIKQWGHRGSGQYGFNYPRGIAVDRRDGSVVVGDSDGQNLKKYTNDGVFVWQVNGLKSWSIDIGPDGRIYAADTGNKRVVVLSDTGSVLYTFGSGGTTPGHFQKDRGIAIDADGSLWVSDAALGIVQHFANNGTYLGQFGSLGTADNQFSVAVGVAVDSSYVYVADQAANKIKVWGKDGTFVGAFSRAGTKLGQLQRPQGVELGPDGHLYVAEQGNERITDFSITPI